MILVVGLVN